MAGKDQPPGEHEPKQRPIVEDRTVEQAQRILAQQGFNRMIQVSRDPKTGKIVDLVLRETV